VGGTTTSGWTLVAQSDRHSGEGQSICDGQHGIIRTSCENTQLESGGKHVANIGHFDEVCSPKRIFEYDVLGVDGWRHVKHEQVECFRALDFILDHADGGSFGHAELDIGVKERESVKQEIPVLCQGG
jgi:hypothetical protein